MRRADWDDFFFGFAKAAAARGDCRRRQVGAVLVRDQRVISTGYNGAIAGELGCMDGGCPRGLQTYEQVAAGSSYNNCIAFHAEHNAILDAARRGVSCEGADMYVSCEPCSDCARLIRQAGVNQVFWKEPLT